METATGPNNGASNRVSRKKSKKRIALLAAGVAAAVLITALCGWLLLRSSSTSATIDGERYQAVFFTNGQVYFGKLKQVNAGYFKLTDVFYIQAQEAAGADSENPQQTSNNSTDIRLIKLGSEVHGPEDEMIISKEQILFFENLKKEGKVSDSIIKYNKEKN